MSESKYILIGSGSNTPYASEDVILVKRGAAVTRLRYPSEPLTGEVVNVGSQTSPIWRRIEVVSSVEPIGVQIVFESLIHFVKDVPQEVRDGQGKAAVSSSFRASDFLGEHGYSVQSNVFGNFRMESYSKDERGDVFVYGIYLEK